MKKMDNRLTAAVMVMAILAACAPVTPTPERGTGDSSVPLAVGLTTGVAAFAIGTTAGVATVGASLLVLPATGKLPIDHALTLATGRDCSFLHFEKTGYYCPAFHQDIDRSNLICVKTLGDIECHERGDRYATRDRPLASPLPPVRSQ